MVSLLEENCRATNVTARRGLAGHIGVLSRKTLVQEELVQEEPEVMVKIRNEHILMALQGTAPSTSDLERSRYKTM